MGKRVVREVDELVLRRRALGGLVDDPVGHAFSLAAGARTAEDDGDPEVRHGSPFC